MPERADCTQPKDSVDGSYLGVRVCPQPVAWRGNLHTVHPDLGSVCVRKRAGVYRVHGGAHQNRVKLNLCLEGRAEQGGQEALSDKEVPSADHKRPHATTGYMCM